MCTGKGWEHIRNHPWPESPVTTLLQLGGTDKIDKILVQRIHIDDVAAIKIDSNPWIRQPNGPVSEQGKIRLRDDRRCADPKIF